MSIFQFISPPLPHFIESGEDTYIRGRAHPSRNRIGVFDMLFVTRGELFIGEEDSRWTVGADQFLLLRPDRYHYPTLPCSTETHFHWLHFQTFGDWNEIAEPETDAKLPVESFAIYLPRCGTLARPQTAFGTLGRLSDRYGQSAPGAKWREQLLFQEMLISLKDERREKELTPQITVAERAAAYLRDNYRTGISYKRLGEHLHFHPNYISRCMKQVFGCTPLEYATRFRVEQAKRLLVLTDQPVGQIAEEAGFGSFPFFVRSFSKHTGMRPRAYRQQFRL